MPDTPSLTRTLLDLITSKKFLATATAVTVYIAGRYGYDVDTAVLDRIFAALLVYVGAQAVADHGKSAAQVTAAQAAAQAAAAIDALPLGAAARDPQAGFVRRRVMLALSIVGLVIACTAVQRAATAHAVVDCTAASSGAIATTAAAMRAEKPDGCAAAGVTDWHCVEGKAISAGLSIGGCAFLEVVTAATKVSAAAAPAEPRPGRAAFESYRASVAGGAAFRTASGDR